MYPRTILPLKIQRFTIAPSAARGGGRRRDLLCIAGRGCEVQLVFGPEDHVLGPDFQDGGRLERRGDGKQGERRRSAALAAVLRVVLTRQEPQTPLNVQGLRAKSGVIETIKRVFC